MLTDEAYTWGLAIYIASAIAALLLFNWWFLRGRSWATRLIFSLPLGALLVTPALVEPGAETLAPALVVLGFQLLLNGFAAAEHAFRPLVLFTGVAFAAAVLLALVSVLRNRRRSESA